MKIETKLRDGKWAFVGETWEEIIKNGWVFAYPNFKEKIIVMTRNGYINEFREVLK